MSDAAASSSSDLATLALDIAQAAAEVDAARLSIRAGVPGSPPPLRAEAEAGPAEAVAAEPDPKGIRTLTTDLLSFDAMFAELFKSESEIQDAQSELDARARVVRGQRDAYEKGKRDAYQKAARAFVSHVIENGTWTFDELKDAVMATSETFHPGGFTKVALSTKLMRELMDETKNEERIAGNMMMSVIRELAERESVVLTEKRKAAEATGAIRKTAAEIRRRFFVERKFTAAQLESLADVRNDTLTLSNLVRWERAVLAMKACVDASPDDALDAEDMYRLVALGDMEERARRADEEREAAEKTQAVLRETFAQVADGELAEELAEPAERAEDEPVELAELAELA